MDKTKATVKKDYKPFVLIILDGFGIAPTGPGNAIKLAKIPFLDSLFEEYPHAELKASGEAVGLFPGTDGNSEAGHINLGAGRIVLQDLVAVSHMISDGTFFRNAAFLSAIKHVKQNKSNLHLMGLLTGTNSAHAYPEHLEALIKLARQNQVKRVYLHLFTDGRDSRQYEGYNFLKELMDKLNSKREHIATIMGRFYAMDRKKAWQRTELAYNALTLGSKIKSDNPLQAIEDAYGRGESDEFIQPTTIYHQGKMLPRIKDNDAVIFFNARSDRARQLTKAFVQPDFDKSNHSFKRKKKRKGIVFVALTDFGPDLPNILTAYPSPDLKHTLPMELSDLRQVYIAETDKYGHMTYFFNGGYASPVGGENRILVKSPDVKSYDQTPHMSAGIITDLIIQYMKAETYDFFGINFANPDMLGHTGNLTATIQSLEFLDECIKRIKMQTVDRDQGWLIITSDHGNAEEVIDRQTGKVDTQHSKFPVPFCIVGPRDKSRTIKLKEHGILADVAPTILYLMGKQKPKEMTGHNLIVT
jgi:2,3-bisphosphoglycerate-independent phosphoglycerate mutase